MADKGDRKGNYQILKQPTALVAMINKEISGTEITEKPNTLNITKLSPIHVLTIDKTSRKLMI